MSRFTLALGLALIAVEVVTAIALMSTGDSGQSGVFIVLAVVAGLAFVVSGLIALARRPENRTGIYLAATGYVWPLGALTASANQWVFAVGYVLGDLVWVPFTALLLAFPTGRLASRLERALPIAAGALVVASSLAQLLFDPDPAPGRCEGCPASPVVVVDAPAVGGAVDVLTSILGVGLIGLVIWILYRRWRSATPAARRVLWPVVGAGVVTMASIGLVIVADQFSESVASFFGIVLLAAFALVPFAFLFGILRTRLARSSVSQLVVALQAGTPLRDALAEALRDPSLDIAYWLDWRRGIGGPGWVDAQGRAVGDPVSDETHSARFVDRGGERVAAVLYDPALDTEREFVDAVTAAAGMAILNERLQAELRAEVNFMDTVTNTAPSLLVNIGTDGRIRNINIAALQATGVDDEEKVRGQYFWNVFIDPDEREEMKARFRAAEPDFPVAQYENVFTNARGEHLVIDWRSAPVHDERGNVVSIVSGGIDISDRKQHEDELRASEERLQAAIRGAPVAIVEVDLDDRVQLWNPAAEHIFGWTADEVIGRVVPVVPPEREEEFRTLLERVRRGEAYTGFETVRVRRDGTRVDVAISAAPIRDAAKTVVGHMALFSDITDRKLHDQELRASRARLVVAADEARQELERNLHDGAQQRLVALSVSLRLAESKLDTDPAATSSILTSAREELAQALSELRELARGIHPAVLTDRGLGPAVEALVARTPVPVEIDVCDGRLPPAVEAASYYVVAEALTNVAKYSNASGASVEVTRADGRVVIQVTDDGAGGADPGRGSGLRGLADRVAALDGVLSVESAVGQGTRVRAEIPVAEQ